MAAGTSAERETKELEERRYVEAEAELAMDELGL